MRTTMVDTLKYEDMCNKTTPSKKISQKNVGASKNKEDSESDSYNSENSDDDSEYDETITNEESSSK